MKNEIYNENDGSVNMEGLQAAMITWLSWLFERHKSINCILGYLIENDYDGRIIMSAEEWDEEISQNNFSVGAKFTEDDKEIHIVGWKNE